MTPVTQTFYLIRYIFSKCALHMCEDITAVVRLLFLRRLSGQELGRVASINKTKWVYFFK